MFKLLCDLGVYKLLHMVTCGGSVGGTDNAGSCPTVVNNTATENLSETLIKSYGYSFNKLFKLRIYNQLLNYEVLK